MDFLSDEPDGRFWKRAQSRGIRGVPASPAIRREGDGSLEPAYRSFHK